MNKPLICFEFSKKKLGFRVVKMNLARHAVLLSEDDPYGITGVPEAAVTATRDIAQMDAVFQSHHIGRIVDAGCPPSAWHALATLLHAADIMNGDKGRVTILKQGPDVARVDIESPLAVRSLWVSIGASFRSGVTWEN